ncbi:hypothetical protein CHLRE_01g010300v5 [Chlamydomonas reinhardtii]|uniref:Uncharacterized protein n=1 Tax=Chlamydomonas reinhardtii TaxID=3055 RepID=A0A2K3E5C7_CHLRE|nr:uncharacterized protein CHLRE_01g010300v5 [Chlamydomonas reinhardtii]PNW88002.1 hypothetical protein CHLRE_01g010300v5 [Chlamydomonas reinhardtii]
MAAVFLYPSDVPLTTWSPTVVTQGTTATLYDNGVPSSSLYLTWYPITLASNSNKWGGYYTLPAPPPGSTYSTLTPPPPSLAAAASGLFMCAGCAMNDASKGYFFGGVTLSVTNTGGVLTASCAVALPPAGSPTSQGTVLSSSVQEVHLYASFDIIDTGAPGQWPKPDSVSPPVGSVGSGGSFTASETVGGSGAAGDVVYLACHLSTTTCFAPSSYGY